MRQGTDFRKAFPKAEFPPLAGSVLAGYKGIQKKGLRYGSCSNTPLLAPSKAYIIFSAGPGYKWVIIAAVIVSWLIAFNVINTHNNFVRSLVAHARRPDRAGLPPRESAA